MIWAHKEELLYNKLYSLVVKNPYIIGFERTLEKKNVHFALEGKF